ncbi:MAG: 2-oxo-4-hydroxy-4-carboxy-5-ureidoimidazoline decarboxylase [Candidatus Rokuibacteriota bacterium]
MDRVAFTRALGAVFEGSPWVAERAWEARPFATVAALHAAMVSAVRRAPAPEQLALLRAHPDLADRAARAGALSEDSEAEQAAAGLDRLTEADYDRFQRLNAAYRRTFDFPFIIAVRKHDEKSILATFEQRLRHTRAQEVGVALAQVADITGLRLEALVGAPTLTTHVLDTAHGCPAGGLRIDLSVIDPEGSARLLKTVVTNAEGRTDRPLLAEGEFHVGHYEIAFHVGAYFRGLRARTADPPFLEVVPVRFAVADPHSHYHVPLLVAPWSYTTYRGS